MKFMATPRRKGLVFEIQGTVGDGRIHVLP